MSPNFLGTELPIIQSPMAGVQDDALALAVSEAGGLGSLPCARATPESMREELVRLARGTTRPYNVNFFCHTPPSPAADREAAWVARLTPYYREFHIDPATIPTGGSRATFDRELLAVLGEFRPRVVSFHFGLPPADLLPPIKAWGGRILSSATTVAEAVWLEAHGADAIIAQGLEAGGHRGMFLSEDLTTQVGTLALVPQIVKRVRVPVIAAGGISDRSGVAAALALGASAVQVGTAYLLCSEAMTPPLHRQALGGEAAGHTALTNIFTGRPARSIVNRIIRELGPICPDAPPFPLAGSALLPLWSAAERAGSSDFSPLWSGQNVSGCRAISAGQLTRELAG